MKPSDLAKAFLMWLFAMGLLFMVDHLNASVINGQPVNAAITNAGFMDKNTVTTFTTAMADVQGGLEVAGVADSTSTGAAQNVTLTKTITTFTNVSLTSIQNLTIANRVDATLVTLRNKTGGALTLKNLSGGTSANQINTGTGLDLILPDSASVNLYYDTVLSKWQVVSAAGADVNATNIATGTLPAARLPNPSSTTLGGIESYGAVSNQWINAISTSGVPSSTQPAFTNISGTATAAQGGTGQSTYTIGDILYASGTTALSKLPAGTINYVLTSGGAGVAPAWAVASSNPPITDDTTTNATMYPTWVTTNTGNLPLKVSSTKLSFNPSTATLSLGVGSANINVPTPGAPGAGGSMSIFSGASGSGGTNNAGGDLGLYAALGTGTGASKIVLNVPQIQASGTTSQVSYSPALTVLTDSTYVTQVKAQDSIRVGAASGRTGAILMYGTTSGTVTVKPVDAAGTYNFNLPITAGAAGQVLTSQGGGSTAMTWGAGGGSGGQNFITNADAEVDTTGWAAYALTESVTFTDVGDLVTLSAHGLATGNTVSFSVITTTTGISINTIYYVIYTSSSTFQLASSLANAQAGTALALTTNGTGTILKSFPMSGTGGSPTVTWTRSTSSPLTGAGSFLFTKDAANRMGEGASFAFTTDLSATAKVMQIEFDYIIGSGTFVAGASGVDSDVEVFVYDVTNSVLIQPSTYKLYSNSNTIPVHFVSNFQLPSNSSSYRLIFHTATLSASAYTLKFDSVVVGPSKYVYGTPITDWTSYTPTGSWTANSPVYTGKWRRVGDNMEIQAKVVCGGAPTSAALTINIPTGYTIDTSKLTGGGGAADVLGGGDANDSGTNYKMYTTPSSTTAFTVLYQSATSGAVTQVTQAAPFTFGASDYVNGFIAVPITGWSSTVQMSDNADQRIVAARYTNTAGTSIANSGETAVPFATKDYDTHSAFVTDTYTIPVAGFYKISCSMNFASSTYAASNRAYAIIYKNGGGYQFGPTVTIGGTPTNTLGVWAQATGNFIAGDTLVCRAANSRTAGATLLDASAGINIFEIQKVQGPSAIGATELIAARYTNVAGTSIANSGEVVIPFATKDYDSHGGFLTDTYTIPAAGKYRIGCVVNFASSLYAASNELYSVIYKNGAVASYGGVLIIGGTPTQIAGASSNATLSLVAGDTIQCRTTNTRTAGATLLNTTGGANSFEIQRVGL